MNTDPEAVFTTLQFLRNLGTGPKSWSVCQWQAFPEQSILWANLQVTKKMECCEYGTQGPYPQHFIFFITCEWAHYA